MDYNIQEIYQENLERKEFFPIPWKLISMENIINYEIWIPENEEKMIVFSKVKLT